MSEPGPTDAPVRRHVPGLVAVAVVTAVAAAVVVVVATSRGPSTARSPGAPADLRARSNVCVPPECDRLGTTVALTWSMPGGAQGIEVLVDGSVLARLDPNTTRYEVHDLWIDRSYTVGVRAFGADGAGPPSAVLVRTPVPQPEDAQLDGSYRVRETVRSAINLSTIDGIRHPAPGSEVTSTWSFSALCGDGDGACAADWFRWGPLVNEGERYEGTFVSRSANCVGGGRTPTTTRMWVVVESGRASDGRWIVGRFHGVMNPSFTCPEGGRSAGVVRIQGRVRL